MFLRRIHFPLAQKRRRRALRWKLIVFLLLFFSLTASLSLFSLVLMPEEIRLWNGKLAAHYLANSTNWLFYKLHSRVTTWGLSLPLSLSSDTVFYLWYSIFLSSLEKHGYFNRKNIKLSVFFIQISVVTFCCEIYHHRYEYFNESKFFMCQILKSPTLAFLMNWLSTADDDQQQSFCVEQKQLLFFRWDL